jgi:hypothetical protein
MKYAVASVLLLAALAMGQSWVVEQVDSTAASGSPVELVKAADGRLWAGYQTESGVVRAACLDDTGWRLTEVGRGSLNGVWRPSMAASMYGELSLSSWTHSPDSGSLYRLVEGTWLGEPYPFMTQPLCGMLAYDTTGRLHTAFVDTSGDFWAGRETDSGWTAGFVVRLFCAPGDHGNAACFTVANDNNPWYFAYVWWMWSPQIWGEEAALMHFSGDSWDTIWDESGRYMPIPLALVPHGTGVGSVSFGNGVLMCDSETVDSISGNLVAGLAYSVDDVPLVAWVPRGSEAQPVFAFKTDRWRLENIPGPAGIGGIDIETDTAGQVVIVYSTSDSGLWCARGTDVVGVEESPGPRVPSRKREATVLSGASGVVFDAMGRRVVNPKPGVYFVREEPQASSHKPQAIRKVVITR